MPDGKGAARIDAWRRALMLFTKTRQEQGPFHAAGYKDYYLEGRDEDGKTPDLFGFDDTWFVVADVTCSPNKDPDSVIKYRESRLPSEVEEFIAPSDSERQVAGAPFVLTNIEPREAVDKINLVVTSDEARVDLHDVTDEALTKHLQAWTGFEAPLPSFNVSAVPESSPDEVREALLGPLKWAAVQDGPVEVEDLVRLLLGDLYESFSKKGRSELRKLVCDRLADLSHRDKATIKYDAGKKTLEITKDYLRKAKRPAFTKSLLEWTGRDTSQIRLLDEEE